MTPASGATGRQYDVRKLCLCHKEDANAMQLTVGRATRQDRIQES